tara:strand:+ start:186 stop:398 length:213 start_codon:yes stop_codon:yes gene_type:complete
VEEKFLTVFLKAASLDARAIRNLVRNPASLDARIVTGLNAIAASLDTRVAERSAVEMFGAIVAARSGFKW